MSSGKVVRSYIILKKYFDILEKIGIDRSVCIPSSNDIELVIRLVSSGKNRLLDILEELIVRFVPRVHREAAKKAVEEVLGGNIDEQAAVNIVAKDLAGWTLEIAENMGLIKIDTNMIR